MMRRPGLDPIDAVDPAGMSAAQLVMTLAGRLRHARLTALEPFGLAPHQARAFLIIGRHSRRADLRPSDLARRLGIAARSVTEVVDALQDKGLVQRQASQTDRRARVLCLTPQGEALMEELREHLSGADDDAGAASVFQALSPAELAGLTALLRKAVGSDGAAGSSHGLSAPLS